MSSSLAPPRHSFRLAIAIPASLTSDASHLRDKTMKIGLVGRAATIFRVDEILIYPDLFGLRDQREDARLIDLLLSYMEMPQYLKKRAFGIRKELKFAGMLPPLRAPHHPLASRIEDLSDGELRDGIVVKCSKAFCHVDVGVERLLALPFSLKVGTRITVRIRKSGGEVNAELATEEAFKTYRGYRVTVLKKSLGEVIRSSASDLVIATSRHGEPLSRLYMELARRLKDSRKVLILFGSPKEGLREIASREGLLLEEATDFILNTISRQGADTVRTEEAIYATLSIINFLEELAFGS
ncbi:MAG: putative RNA uridine N3 methyltransferase [Candidatus Bathyarchaeia archaeon]